MGESYLQALNEAFCSPVESVTVESVTQHLNQTRLETLDDTLQAHLDLLRCDFADEDAEELSSSPIFTAPVLAYGTSLDTRTRPFSQYGLLGAASDKRFKTAGDALSAGQDPRIFYNTVAPSSVFICGSQGSGKSHTVSCLLENCLTPSSANVLPRPLTGIVFHYDPWCSDTGGTPCEAACLSSASNVSVRVLCPPTNIGQIRRIYSHLPRVTVEELRINESDLNTRRMLDLMAVSSSQGSVPLYVHVVTRILRELRTKQQASGLPFNYRAFKDTLLTEGSLTAFQQGPLGQRLDALESFMVKAQVEKQVEKQHKKSKKTSQGNSWTPKVGQLTIVDLSCPCVTVEMACSLFNICLSLFLEQDSKIGRVVALDEAHKYMTDTAECQTLTNALLANIRLQRHLGMRVIISTQEPTISPRLLDLCSITIVHRFTSPDWLQSLKKHLAGASAFARGRDDSDRLTAEELATQLFSRIVALARGEALVFAPSAVIGVQKPGVDIKEALSSSPGSLDSSAASLSSGASGSKEMDKPGDRARLIKLGHGVLNVRVRKRVTQDGGRSIMAA